MTDLLRTTFRFNNTETDMAAQLRRPGSVEAQAVRDLTSHDDLTHASAPTLLHAIIEAGIRAIQEQAERIRCDQLAEFLKDDPEHKAWMSARRRRVAPWGAS